MTSEPLSDNREAFVRAELERLESDLRVLSPVGIERAAWGWDRHEANPSDFLAAEQTALKRVGDADALDGWDEWRRRVFYEVEGGRLALEAWRAEHQRHSDHVHKAERAALGAALGLYARPRVSHETYATLVSAMAEALPWLLPERPPTPGAG
jgi:hypothetical protein